MLSFNIADDLIEAQQVLQNFIASKEKLSLLESIIYHCADSIKKGGKIISAGNGGSMCDAQHFAEELTGRFRDDRPSLPAIAICDPSHLTCVGNDYGFDYVFSRFVQGMGQEGDIFLGISTSGNSQNIIEAVKVAKDKKMSTICLLGRDGGKLKDLCDFPLIVEHHGYADRSQEIHTMLIHIMIRGIEELMRT